MSRSLAYWLAAPVGGVLVILISLPFIPLILLWGAWDALRLVALRQDRPGADSVSGNP